MCEFRGYVVAKFHNTVTRLGLRLQLPPSPLRAHYVKALVKLREYADGTLALFHGPRLIARYTEDGTATSRPRAA